MQKIVDGFVSILQASIAEFTVCSGPRLGYAAQYRWKVDIVCLDLLPSVPGMIADYLRALDCTVERSEIRRGVRFRVKRKGQKYSGTVYLRSAHADDYGGLQLYYTGPVAFIEKLKGRAGDLGYWLDQSGLWFRGELTAGRSEALIFQALGVKFVEPRDRLSATLTFLF